MPSQERAWRFSLPGWRWTHVDLEHGGASAALGAEGWLPGDALDLIRDPDDAPRLESVGEVAMGVLPDFAPAGAQGGGGPSSWRFVMRADRIVTAQRLPCRGLLAARRACEADSPPAGPAELVEGVLAGFASEAARRATALDGQATELEDELLDGQGTKLGGLGLRLGRIRREATRLQRVVLPVERLTREEMQVLPGWAASPVHDAARRRILSAVDDLRALAEHGRALQDELAARQGEATTRNLNVLSLLSAVLLPPSLVAGFFGMNTKDLPFEEVEYGTLYAAGAALSAVVLTLVLLRLRRVL